MMRVGTARAIISFATIGATRSFTIPTTRSVARKAFKVSKPIIPSIRIQGTNDDDWYADFDPSAFDDIDTNVGTSRAAVSRNSNISSGPSRGGKRSGGGHDYERDTSVDNSNVNLEQVNALIAERLEARKTGRFDDADEIRDKLLDEHGVSVWDKDKQWRSGSSRSGSGSKLGAVLKDRAGGRDSRGGRDGRPDRDFRGGRDSRADRDSRGGRDSRSGDRKPRDFGPNGHDYQLAPNAGPNASSLSESEIHRRIAERLRSKMSRNFSHADAIQDEFEKFGVYVHDGRKEWRADGERFGSDSERGGKPGREPGSRMDRIRPYVQSPHSEQTDDLAQIEELLNERLAAKKARAFDDADAIQGELRRNFNVEINDKTREWSVGGDFGVQRREQSGPYVMASVSDAPDDGATIQKLVDQREDARKRRDFDEADEILDVLRATYDVFIDDKLRQWSIGGSFDKPGRGPPDDSPFQRRGGGDLTKEQEATIAKLVEERNNAKRDKDFGKADRIRDRLGDEFLVRVDDRSREWRVVTAEYVMSPVTAIDEDTKAFIEKKISERAVAKLQKDYDQADAIRDELSENYGVYLDDRVKEWFIEDIEGETQSLDTAEGSYDEDDENDDDDAMFDLPNSDEVDDLDEAMENAFAEENADFTGLTVMELKEQLRNLGLPVSGNKMELIERLGGRMNVDR